MQVEEGQAYPHGVRLVAKGLAATALYDEPTGKINVTLARTRRPPYTDWRRLAFLAVEIMLRMFTWPGLVALAILTWAIGYREWILVNLVTFTIVFLHLVTNFYKVKRMSTLRRYHGAEHLVVSAMEAGDKGSAGMLAALGNLPDGVAINMIRTAAGPDGHLRVDCGTRVVLAELLALIYPGIVLIDTAPGVFPVAVLACVPLALQVARLLTIHVQRHFTVLEPDYHHLHVAITCYRGLYNAVAREAILARVPQIEHVRSRPDLSTPDPA